jgi:IclR family transcriptional regulator, KDG regulon repressor
MTAAPIADQVRDDRATVDKAISLLVAFGDQASSGVGVSELARRTRLNKSTAYRVLGMLERNGVVERVGTRYRLGARLHELGRSVYAPGSERTRDLLLPFVTDLYEATRHTVHLATLHGTDVVYLVKLYGHRPVPAPSRVGGHLPAYCTAVGKVQLAFDPDAAAQLTGTAPLRPFTARTITDPAALAAELERIRRDGIAFDEEESQAGLSCVAAPVFGVGGRPVAALSIAGPAGRIDTRRVSAGLRQVAAAASQAATRARLTRA